MNTADEHERRKAFDQADAILALEGFRKPEGFEQLQEQVVTGAMTFEDAINQVISEARVGRGAGK